MQKRKSSNLNLLIRNNFKKTKKTEIFILLQFIDGNLIEKENLIDSIRNEKDHFGFKPKFDLLSLFNRIQELEELNKTHQSELNENEQNKLNENQQNDKFESNKSNKEDCHGFQKEDFIPHRKPNHCINSNSIKRFQRNANRTNYIWNGKHRN